jgi:hypothetical protein
MGDHSGAGAALGDGPPERVQHPLGFEVVARRPADDATAEDGPHHRHQRKPSPVFTYLMSQTHRQFGSGTGQGAVDQVGRRGTRRIAGGRARPTAAGGAEDALARASGGRRAFAPRGCRGRCAPRRRYGLPSESGQLVSRRNSPGCGVRGLPITAPYSSLGAKGWRCQGGRVNSNSNSTPPIVRCFGLPLQRSPSRPPGPPRLFQNVPLVPAAPSGSPSARAPARVGAPVPRSRARKPYFPAVRLWAPARRPSRSARAEVSARPHAVRCLGSTPEMPRPTLGRNDWPRKRPESGRHDEPSRELGRRPYSLLGQDSNLQPSG